ncbi:MAG: hypothetical protein WCY30_02280 [Candidatus Neomarinimicrobiota bacterium]
MNIIVTPSIALTFFHNIATANTTNSGDYSGLPNASWGRKKNLYVGFIIIVKYHMSQRAMKITVKYLFPQHISIRIF